MSKRTQPVAHAPVMVVVKKTDKAIIELDANLVPCPSVGEFEASASVNQSLALCFLAGTVTAEFISATEVRGGMSGFHKADADAIRKLRGMPTKHIREAWANYTATAKRVSGFSLQRLKKECLPKTAREASTWEQLQDWVHDLSEEAFVSLPVGLYDILIAGDIKPVA